MFLKTVQRVGRLSLIFLVSILASGFWPVSSFAAPADNEIPPGFRQVLSGYGVELYQKDYPGGNPDYVQLVNLGMGAGIQNLHGTVTSPGIGQGVYGGDNPSLERRSLPAFWQDLSTANPNAFCVSNGQFFLMEDPLTTPLPFPLKKDGVLVSDGYGINEFPDRKLILELWPDRADIRTLTPESLSESTAPDIVAGLSADASKRIERYVGRTFIGIDDQNGDGSFETVLIFNTLSARQEDAASVLDNFGAEKVMMLDGGGSTQLICRGSWVIQSERLIPQALGTTAGNPPPLAVSFGDVTNWAVLIAAQNYHSQVNLSNTGSEAWNPETDQLVVDNSWGERTVLLLDRPVQPGESIVLGGDFIAPQRWGVYTVKAYMQRGSRPFDSPAINSQLIVLPPELADRKAELLTNLETWQASGSAQASQAAQNWIRDQARAAGVPSSEGLALSGSIDVRAVLLIPIFMLPVIVILVVMIGRIRGQRMDTYE